MFGLYVVGSAAVYLAGMFLITYLHGRFNPYKYEMDELEIAATVLWPLSLVLFIPVALIVGIIIGIGYVGGMIREKGRTQVRERFDAERRIRDAEDQIGRIEMFEDTIHQDMVQTQLEDIEPEEDFTF